MKLRCPYCQEIFVPGPKPGCPHCGKVMFMPRSLRRKAEGAGPDGAAAPAKPRPAKAPRAAGTAGVPRWLAFTRKPRVVIWVIGLLLIASSVLIRQAGRGSVAESAIGEDDSLGGRIWRGLFNLPTSVRNDKPETRALESLQNLRTALEMFYGDCRRYPTTSETLFALIRRPRGAKGWAGPYIQALWVDPWKHPYRYAYTNGVVELCSPGPDGQYGSADDIQAPPPDSAILADYLATNPAAHKAP
jgi:type II secretion system protein G